MDVDTLARTRPLDAVVVGECLIELVGSGPGELTLRAAGDTFNTASTFVHASRALGSPVEVAYRTGLGDDPLSDVIADAMRDDGLVDASIRLPGRACGLYLLDRETGAMWYWRGDSAARALFQGEDWVPEGAAGLVFLSLITLQQMGERARDRAAEWVETIRDGGGTVAFSANHRAAGWPSPEQAAAEAARFAARADLVFASVGDCLALFGTAGPEAALDRLAELGTAEAIVTAGEGGAWMRTGAQRLHVPAVAPAEPPVDATGAGDAFAGAYLAWRTAGRSPEAAARAAVRVASQTVTFVGALPRSGSPDRPAMDAVLSSLAGEPTD